ncbi:MAG: molybdopterin-guanine dinucleotide biosynthesis protein B [Thermoleophilia bacterium]|nr:molybdopterin-guanine dinucleotide biosynthesis protein B [Thermoleophilia bacterium]
MPLAGHRGCGVPSPVQATIDLEVYMAWEAGSGPAVEPSFPSGVSLALQSGGASRRMGGDKATTRFVDGTLLEWIRDRVAPLFGHVFVVANDPARFRMFGLPVVTDALDERGSAVGVYTALLASPTDRVLCLACDMPFVTPRLLRRLVEGSVGSDVFVPRHGPYMQPVCAVYSRAIAGVFEDFLAEGERRIDAIYNRVNTEYLDVDDGRFGHPDELFMNVNTPEELAAARERALREIDAGLTTRRGVVLRDSALLARGGAGGAPSLAPRIEAFRARSLLPVVSFVGKKKSGKTTVLVGVIRELAGRGYRVAALKHDTHGFDVDIPGTDSYRLREAGAVVTGISSPDTYVWVNRSTQEPTLEQLVARISEPVDLVITEGFKRKDAPKIEVSRRERSSSLICDEDELVGIVSDQRFDGYRVPQLAMDDFAAIADLVEVRILGGKRSAVP